MTEQKNDIPERLASLDALRGFDMFWIMGGEGILISLAALTGWPAMQILSEQMHHAAWDGFRFYDVIFPLFLFIAGIAFPFSLKKKSIADSYNKRTIYKHLIARGLIFVLLGILYNNSVRFDLANLRYCSVLGRIGIAWMIAALIYMNSKTLTRIIIFWSLLILYWLILSRIRAPGVTTADIYSQNGNIVSYVDRLLLPGKLYRGNHDPEGILSTIPAVSTALLGMFTGEFLLSDYFKKTPARKGIILVAVSILLIILGLIWNLFFPINKNLWTSSFVCFAGGLSMLLFSVFYLIIDVWKFKKWSFIFIVIGVNPITIYLAKRIIDFSSASNFLFGGISDLLPEVWSPVIQATGITIVGWIFLYFLYRKKIFLRI
jgi:predicted acyltransferase